MAAQRHSGRRRGRRRLSRLQQRWQPRPRRRNRVGAPIRISRNRTRHAVRNKRNQSAKVVEAEALQRAAAWFARCALARPVRAPTRAKRARLRALLDRTNARRRLSMSRAGRALLGRGQLLERHRLLGLLQHIAQAAVAAAGLGPGQQAERRRELRLHQWGRDRRTRRRRDRRRSRKLARHSPTVRWR